MRVTRKCVCRRSVAVAAEFEAGRPLLQRFAEIHQGCCRAAATGAAGPHRCEPCGLLLLFGDMCPGHPGTARLPWRAELEAAFCDVVVTLARGGPVALPAGAGGDLMFTAKRHADRPGWAWILERARQALEVGGVA